MDLLGLLLFVVFWEIIRRELKNGKIEIGKIKLLFVEFTSFIHIFKVGRKLCQ
jgi:hypothetical protein